MPHTIDLIVIFFFAPLALEWNSLIDKEFVYLA